MLARHDLLPLPYVLSSGAAVTARVPNHANNDNTARLDDLGRDPRMKRYRGLVWMIGPNGNLRLICVDDCSVAGDNLDMDMFLELRSYRPSVRDVAVDLQIRPIRVKFDAPRTELFAGLNARDRDFKNGRRYATRSKSTDDRSNENSHCSVSLTDDVKSLEGGVFSTSLMSSSGCGDEDIR